MRLNRIFQRITRLVLILLIVLPAVLISPSPAESAGFVSDVVPFVGIFSSFRARNRVYRTANAYIQDKREYYDRLREKARDQLIPREIGGLRKSQVAAYVKLVALIEGERKAMIDFAESEKRAAREKFINDIENVIVNRILASGAATRALGALSKGVDSSQGLVDQALDELAGGSGALEKVQRIRRIASRVSMAGSLIGGSVGEKIQVVGGSIVKTIDRPSAEIEAGLDQVKGDLADLQSEIAVLQDRGVQPTSSQVTREVALTVVTGEGGDPAVDAIVSLLAGKAAREGQTFRGRARSAILGTFVARCAAIGQAYRNSIAKLEAEAGSEPLSDEQASAPCNAIDLDQLAAEVEATREVLTETETPEPDDDIGFELLSLTVDEAWCFPRSEGTTSEHCYYGLTWEIDYRTPFPPATVVCYLQRVDIYNSETRSGEVLEDSGTWKQTIQQGGFYPSLGEYTETLSCELRQGDFEAGNLLASLEQTVTVPLTTVREP